MNICLVTAFPPSGRQLNEYGYHLARELRKNPLVNLTILADRLTDYQWATDENGQPLSADDHELNGFQVVRCWDTDKMASSLNIAKAVRRMKPDVVWFNLVYSTFATQAHPVAAFAGLCTPALTRAMGYFTHVTLHHILEQVNFADAGVKQEQIFRLGSYFATKALLRSNSVTVLLPGYR
ncbi:MAG: group 1 glycosyl transferase, partial [Terriglobales bacterium]